MLALAGAGFDIGHHRGPAVVRSDLRADLDRMVSRENGKIPRKHRELIAVAVAHTTQCPYCIEVHVKGAKKAGASKEEVAEAVLLAAALRAGGAAAHGGMAMRFFDED